MRLICVVAPEAKQDLHTAKRSVPFTRVENFRLPSTIANKHVNAKQSSLALLALDCIHTLTLRHEEIGEKSSVCDASQLTVNLTERKLCWNKRLPKLVK